MTSLGLTNFLLVLLTAVIAASTVWYVIETVKLRRAQTEPRVFAFVEPVATGERKIIFKNIGHGVAFRVRLEPHGGEIPRGIGNWEDDAVSVLPPGCEHTIHLTLPSFYTPDRPGGGHLAFRLRWLTELPSDFFTTDFPASKERYSYFLVPFEHDPTLSEEAA